MANLNFVPDDYVKNNESSRTNLMYLVLLAITMAGLGGSFVTVKIRQKACQAKETLITSRMDKMQATMAKLDELQIKRTAMMKTALTTAELLEPVPRTILLATLTNNLPVGTSLLNVSLIQKAPKDTPSSSASTSKFQAATSGSNTQTNLSPEQMLETHIQIDGMAPSDLQVAAYIQRLDDSSLMDNVALVETKEYKVEDNIYRQFKLTAMLKKDVHLTREDIENIKNQSMSTMWNF